MKKELTAHQRALKKYTDNHALVRLTKESHKLISEKAKQCNTTIAYALSQAIAKYVEGDK